VGINATRAYTKKFSNFNGLISVGRVQSPVLKLIVDRWKANQNFKPEDFWEILGTFEKGSEYTGHYFPDEKIKKFGKKEEALALLKELEPLDTATVSLAEKKQKSEPAPLLFDLTNLQKVANKSFKFSADKTLKIAQALYERHKIITYPRTDSRHLTGDIKKTIKVRLNAIESCEPVKKAVSELNKENLSYSSRFFNDKKVSDHHAIIPTEKRPNVAALSEDEVKIYFLLVKSFVAIFMEVCKKEVTKIITEAKDKPFITQETLIRQLGWRALYNEGDTNKPAPTVKKGDVVTIKKPFELLEKQTQAPLIHTESSLLSAMENAGREVDDAELKEAIKKCGLGTPATRAEIIEKLIRVKYIVREKNKLIPTEKGIVVADLVSPTLSSAELTAEWEMKLNDIYKNGGSAQDFMDEIKSFCRTLIGEVKESQQAPLPSNRKKLGTCPLCKGDINENAKAFGCSNWKEKQCKFTIWKTIAGKTISEKLAIKLITEGKTELLKGFKSKAGKPFETTLKMEKGRVVFVF